MNTIDLLNRLEIFRDLTSREKEILSIVLLPRHLSKGEILFKEGASSPNFFIVVSGVLESSKKLKTGMKTKIRKYFKGDVVGLIDMFTSTGKRTQTVRALEDSVLLECSRDHFQRLFESQSLFSYKMIDSFVTSLSKNLRDANNSLIALFKDPKETLLKLNETLVSIRKGLF